MNQYSWYFFTCVLISLPYISTERFFHPFPRAHQLNAQHVIYVEEQVILLINPGSWILQYFSGNFFHWKPGCQLIFCMCGARGTQWRDKSASWEGGCLLSRAGSFQEPDPNHWNQKKHSFFVDSSGLWIKSISFTDSALLENSVLQNQSDCLTDTHSYFNICSTLRKASCRLFSLFFFFENMFWLRQRGKWPI